jgi:hypothetical protein
MVCRLSGTVTTNRLQQDPKPTNPMKKQIEVHSLT